MNNLIKNVFVWFAIAMILVTVFNVFDTNQSSVQVDKISYSTFIDQVNTGEVASVTIKDRNITGRTQSGRMFMTLSPGDPGLIGDLLENGVEVEAVEEQERSLLMQIFISWFPMLLLIGVWIFFMRQVQGGGRGAMMFGKSKAKILSEDRNKVTFKDVAGVDEAKEEVQELVEFLRNPQSFTKLGGKIPRGVLMTGSPGTGKTLLAKAIAGEASVPFYSISGSDFVEMFVGVGASRVRDMFEQARKSSPCIIFIDEIDAVGRHRGAGLGGGHDEREQTLNQLLVEMDGFGTSDSIIVIAATNRPDVLDPALLRPGRFDRQVNVPLPDILGREQILKVHTRKVPLSSGVDLRVLARGTPGFSGADLANFINEAALMASRAKRRKVGMDDFESAKDKVIMGVERRSMVMSEEDRRNTAYHESGHTVVAKSIDETDPVHKVTIIPRGRALGVTMQLPEEDKYSQNREYLLARIAVLMGGRIAEEIFMKQMTTGASNDFEQATKLATSMVSRWGMSDRLGTRVYADDDTQVFLGKDMTHHRNLSDEVAAQVDEEITRVINEQYHRARTILEESKPIVEMMTECLLEWETLDSDQINLIMQGKRPPIDSDQAPSNEKTHSKKRKGGVGATPDVDEQASDLS